MSYSGGNYEVFTRPQKPDGADTTNQPASPGSSIDDQIRRTLEEKGYAVLERAAQIRYGQKTPVSEIIRILNRKAEINLKTAGQ